MSAFDNNKNMSKWVQVTLGHLIQTKYLHRIVIIWIKIKIKDNNDNNNKRVSDVIVFLEMIELLYKFTFEVVSKVVKCSRRGQFYSYYLFIYDYIAIKLISLLSIKFMTVT